MSSAPPTLSHRSGRLTPRTPEVRCLRVLAAVDLLDERAAAEGVDRSELVRLLLRFGLAKMPRVEAVDPARHNAGPLKAEMTNGTADTLNLAGSQGVSSRRCG